MSLPLPRRNESDAEITFNGSNRTDGSVRVRARRAWFGTNHSAHTYVEALAKLGWQAQADAELRLELGSHYLRVELIPGRTPR